MFDLARRQDANLHLAGEVVTSKREYADGVWRGLTVSAGASFRIPDIRRFVTFRHFPAQVGWRLDVPAGGTAQVRLLSTADQAVVGEFTVGAGLYPVTIPWPLAPCGAVDLELSYTSSGRPLFVGNHKLLSRQWLYDLCVGRGIEIGPGPVPQILPGEGRDVSYLEQMPAEEWNRLYNGGGKYPVRPELWSSYIVGEASDMPVPDGSLDFIFGSHVFEHLANPLGHLQRWHAKLRPGGKVIMVVPDLHGTKDSVHHRCSIESMIDELARDIWLPEAAHYSRHLRRSVDDPRLIALMDRGESIHVHYYDNINCQQLLDFAVRELGYGDYVINHTPNHKDFHFVLVR
nr:methyltransferase domain-containing protein [Novosphingobium piscinae]